MSSYTREQAQRDFNAHKPARVAAALWGSEYARRGLGLMGFWDQLDAGRRRIARDIVADIAKARDETFEEAANG